jgi:hypothetical protein
MPMLRRRSLTIELESSDRVRLDELAAHAGLTPAQLAAAAMMAFLERAVGPTGGPAEPRRRASVGYVLAAIDGASMEVSPHTSSTKQRRLGRMKSRIRLAPDVDDTPPEVLESIARGASRDQLCSAVLRSPGGHRTCMSCIRRVPQHRR